MVSAPISGAHCTAVDDTGLADCAIYEGCWGGLSSGIYQRDAYFTIEARDEFGNRVTTGPVKETQVITTSCDDAATLGGTFTLSFEGQASGPIAAGSDAPTVRGALESLGSIGSVSVTRTLREQATGAQLSGTFGMARSSDEVSTTADCTGEISAGGFVVFAGLGEVFEVVSIDAAKIVIGAAWSGADQSGSVASVVSSTKKGHVYTVVFNSEKGDLEAIVANHAALTPEASAAADVDACELHFRQTITTSGDAALSGSFRVHVGEEHTADMSVATTTAAELEAALEGLSNVFEASVLLKSGPDANGGHEYVVQLDSLYGVEPLEELYAEGHLMRGKGARVEVASECPTAAGGEAMQPLVSTLRLLWRHATGRVMQRLEHA